MTQGRCRRPRNACTLGAVPIRPATRTEVDRLLRVAADVWRRIGQLPRGGRADLPTLDAAIRSGALPLTKPLHALGVGAAFGIILAAELKLSWVLCDDYEPPQMALRRAEGKVPTITFPIDMIEKRVQERRAVELEVLFDGVLAILRQHDPSVGPHLHAPTKHAGIVTLYRDGPVLQMWLDLERRARAVCVEATDEGLLNVLGETLREAVELYSSKERCDAFVLDRNASLVARTPSPLIALDRSADALLREARSTLGDSPHRSMSVRVAGGRLVFVSLGADHDQVHFAGAGDAIEAAVDVAAARLGDAIPYPPLSTADLERLFAQ